MDAVIAYFLSLQSVMLSTAIIAITYLTRVTVEHIWPSLAKQSDENSIEQTYASNAARWWNQVVLYLIPQWVGFAFCFLPSTLIFPETVSIFRDRMIYSIVIAWLSQTIYKIFKKTLSPGTGT